MRDEPTGRYVTHQARKPVTAKRFHLYRDCGLIAGLTPPDYEVVDLGLDPSRDALQLIELLGLSPCSSCEKRSQEVSVFDCIADSLAWMATPSGVDAMFGGATPQVRAVIELLFLDSDAAAVIAGRLIADLEKSGYAIKRIKKGGPT